MIDALDIDLAPVVAAQPFPVLFATVSGAHLYGFPSRDSDVDLRGVHLLPAADLVGLREPEETLPHSLNGMGGPPCGCGTGTASRWTWSRTTCASSCG